LQANRFGTYSTSEAVNAGLDLEMPGPTRWRGAALSHAVTANKVKLSQLNDRVRNVLGLINLTSTSGVPENAPETCLNRSEDRDILRQIAAQSIVLLKNDENILPLKKSRSIAVIGPNSKIATISGGGSASLNPYYAVTPYEGIKSHATSDVEFAQGVYGHQSTPQLGKHLRTDDGRQGFTMRVYNEPPTATERTVLEERILTDSTVFFIDYSHPKLSTIWYADSEGIFTPEESGTYDFGLCLQGTGRLFIDGELIVSNIDDQKSGPSFLGAGTIEEVGTKELEAGKQYRLLLQWGCAKTSKLKVPGVVDFGHGGFRFGGCKRLSPTEGIKQAVTLARGVDQVVLFSGLSAEWESEGQDRDTMDLPPFTDTLISEVLLANPNTVIVVQSGTPVSMPWINDAKAVLHAWYGGNETGNAIADVIYGDVNPVCPLTSMTE
jgi:beta-glucosidase